jgi:hypothetical protein
MVGCDDVNMNELDLATCGTSKVFNTGPNNSPSTSGLESTLAVAKVDGEEWYLQLSPTPVQFHRATVPP